MSTENQKGKNAMVIIYVAILFYFGYKALRLT